jgi:hypothetical protein
MLQRGSIHRSFIAYGFMRHAGWKRDPFGRNL